MERFNRIGDLCNILDSADYLKGRYILLPNVNEGGRDTVLRAGFAGTYKDMPCVGGYVDGPVAQHGRGNEAIVQGKNREYGFKPLGVIQTSDNRRADFQDLGTHVSWIKWVEPTAEAIRQACLARTTRILNTPPELPSVVIRSVEVSNSKFMGPIALELNPQLNCFIGGRGTGKSTVLEYLRWALCDQPPAGAPAGEMPDVQAKRVSLIDNTLIPLEAVVTVTFLLNNVPHVIRRYSKARQVMLKVGSGEFEPCQEDDVRRLLPIQAYSQKQLSAVSVREEELYRFVATPLEKELDRLRSESNEVKSLLRTVYERAALKRGAQRQLAQSKLELDSVTQQVRKLRGELSGLSPEDQTIIVSHEAHLSEEAVTESLVDQLGGLDTTLCNALSELELLQEVSIPEGIPNAAALEALRALVEQVRREAVSGVAALRARLLEDPALHPAFEQGLASWRELFAAHSQAYEEAKGRAAAQESKLKEISIAEARSKTLGKAVQEKERALQAYGEPEAEYAVLRGRLRASRDTQSALLEGKCAELTTLSVGAIRARLRRGVGLESARERLDGLIAGTRIRKNKTQELCDFVCAAAEPVSAWEQVLEELEKLLLGRGEEGFRYEALAAFSRAGFSTSDLERIAERLTPEAFLDVSLTDVEDVPVFEYRQREGDYIQFAQASAGQQATALLRVLLKQDGPPLLIDQPEEDLDNQVVLDIVEELWTAKSRRQLIFASHNANIVVNGDADLVVVCDYRMAGDQSGGLIKAVGAIDVKEIREDITTVMEGGQKAFQLRLQKYGF